MLSNFFYESFLSLTPLLNPEESEYLQMGDLEFQHFADTQKLVYYIYSAKISMNDSQMILKVMFLIHFSLTYGERSE